jgi:cytochrome c oxidase subunit 4
MTLRPPRALLWSWAGLLGLLALTVTLAYQPLTGIVALLIALAKALIVAVVFMELRAARPLVIAVAGTGFFWLAILLWLSAMDFMTRPDFPPRLFPEAAAGATAGTTAR